MKEVGRNPTWKVLIVFGLSLVTVGIGLLIFLTPDLINDLMKYVTEPSCLASAFIGIGAGLLILSIYSYLDYRKQRRILDQGNIETAFDNRIVMKNNRRKGDP